MNFNGIDSFNYTVSDGHGNYATAKVIITVSAVNDAPVANNDTVNTNSGIPTVINILHNDYDVDGDILTVISVTGAKYGTVKLNPDGTVTYTPNMNFAGTDTFYYTISDRNGLTSTAAVTVNVASQPVFTNPADVAVQFKRHQRNPNMAIRSHLL